MGTRGPVGKRSDKRHGHRSAAQNAVTKLDGAHVVPVPEPDDSWHPVAVRWFRALADSGQAQFYEPSDWATAYLMAESMSRDLKPQFVGFQEVGLHKTEALFERIPLKGASLAAYLRAMNDLLATEGARRRVRVELQRPDEDVPDNVIDWQSRVGNAPAGA